jgi:hypothetical protein
MTEIVLIIVIIVLCGLLGWEKRENKLERSKFINAILAKNASELANLEFVDKIKPEDTKPPVDPLVSTAQMDDEEFDKHIQEELKNG